MNFIKAHVKLIVGIAALILIVYWQNSWLGCKPIILSITSCIC